MDRYAECNLASITFISREIARLNMRSDMGAP